MWDCAERWAPLINSCAPGRPKSRISRPGSPSPTRRPARGRTNSPPSLGATPESKKSATPSSVNSSGCATSCSARRKRRKSAKRSFETLPPACFEVRDGGDRRARLGSGDQLGFGDSGRAGTGRGGHLVADCGDAFRQLEHVHVQGREAIGKGLARSLGECGEAPQLRLRCAAQRQVREPRSQRQTKGQHRQHRAQRPGFYELEPSQALLPTRANDTTRHPSIGLRPGCA